MRNNMMQPKISIIIPTYNRSGLLTQAVRSVQAQTFRDWELIIVDDGSTDDTRAVAGKMARDDARIHYVYEPNAGQAAARNKGVESARGEYLAFLDSDDVYLPENLEKKLAFLESHPDALMVNGPSWIVEYATKKFVDCAAYAPTNWLVRREFFNAAGGFAPQERNAEDMGLRVRAANAFDGREMERFLPEPLTIYFLHPGQVSRRPDEQPEIFKKRMETLLPNLDPEKMGAYAKFAPYILSHYANFCALDGEMATARRYFKNALNVKFKPFTAVFLGATYLGRVFYTNLEKTIRSLQHGVVWKLRLRVAVVKYRHSFDLAKSLA